MGSAVSVKIFDEVALHAIGCLTFASGHEAEGCILLSSHSFHLGASHPPWAKYILQNLWVFFFLTRKECNRELN